jgi:Ca2+-binding EF-hand superfamily protein
MKTTLLTAEVLLSATSVLAQNTPGDQFLQNWDLDGNGTATIEELHEMRSNVFTSFDANEDGSIDAEEYVLFDEARAADVGNYQAGQRDQMQRVADGMSLPASDLDKDGRVSLDEFLTGADRWFAELDRNGDGGITLDDFGR